MPVIKLTKADVLRSQNLENEKWYSWVIKSFTGPKPSKDRQSLNFEMTLELIDCDPELDGKEIRRTYNSKMFSMLIPLQAAVLGIPVDQMPKADTDLDTDAFVGKKIDGRYVLELYEGQLIGKCENYLPYKASQTQGNGF